MRFVETYDPSLPDVHGDRDQLIQVFLNLVKNAAQAMPEEDGANHEIRIELASGKQIRSITLPNDPRLNLYAVTLT